MARSKAFTRQKRDQLDQQTPGTPYVIFRQGKGEGVPVKNTPPKKTGKRSSTKGK